MRRIALTVMMAFSIHSTLGCIGNFPLTRAVYNVNSATDSKIVEELLFLVFFFLGVYGFAMFIDIIALNLIQFWLGDDAEPVEGKFDDITSYRFEPIENTDRAIVTITRENEVILTQHLQRVDNYRMNILNEAGEFQGHLTRNDTNVIRYFDADGKLVSAPVELDALLKTL
jgi:hypothetical protein